MASYKQKILNPAVCILSFHLPGQRKIFTKPNVDDSYVQKILESTMSHLERYFARPPEPNMDALTFCQYKSNFMLVDESQSNILDSGIPVKGVKERKKKKFVH